MTQRPRIKKEITGEIVNDQFAFSENKALKMPVKF